jgi:hypothetical protein
MIVDVALRSQPVRYSVDMYVADCHVCAQLSPMIASFLIHALAVVAQVCTRFALCAY